MIGNFFQVTCPLLYELNTIAYFAVFRNAHTYGTMASGPPGPAPINSDTSFKSIQQSYQQTS
jgi:hypothetical protein